MRQSTIIFGSLLFAFIIYITLLGQLPSYLGLFSPKKNVAKQEQNNSDTKPKEQTKGIDVSGLLTNIPIIL